MCNDTKKRPFSVGWTVISGPDRSHLVDVQVFDKKRDALAALSRLAPRPRQLWRHTWEHPYTTSGERRMVLDLTNRAREAAAA